MKKNRRSPVQTLEQSPAVLPLDQQSEGYLFAEIRMPENLAGYEFRECTFRKAAFSGRMRGCLFADCIFEHGDLSNLDFRECAFRRCEFHAGRLTGTDFSGSSWQDVLLAGCKGSYANFSGGTMKMCGFRDNLLNEAAFTMCRWQDLELAGCDLTGSEFLDTSLKGVDLSGNIIDGILVEPKGLQGAVISPEQAVLCAALLGMKIRQ